MIFFYSYDYLFDPDEHEEVKVPCLCNAPNCRKFLNWKFNFCTAADTIWPFSDPKIFHRLYTLQQ